jgi:hypothetical protein
MRRPTTPLLNAGEVRDNTQRLNNTERVQKYRRRKGSRQVSFEAEPEVAAGIIYLRKQWGMTTNRQAVMAAVRFLVLMTRCGLQHLPQTLDD